MANKTVEQLREEAAKLLATAQDLETAESADVEGKKESLLAQGVPDWAINEDGTIKGGEFLEANELAVYTVAQTLENLSKRLHDAEFKLYGR